MINLMPNAVTPSPADTKAAGESSKKLSKLIGQRKKPKLRLASEHRPDEQVALPEVVSHLLASILSQMAQGKGITIVANDAELTTQQAAEFLNVSRPHLVTLIDKGELPHRKVGRHRRVLFQDVMNYKRRTQANRLQALEELSALDQELGLGY
jgi:excisionase family DNA binding protein